MRVRKRASGAYLVLSGLLCLLLGLATSMCGSDSDGQGGLTLLMVDDPIDTVTSLNVTIESIEVHGNGPPTELSLNPDVEQPVNILELENGVFARLVDGNENPLPAGTYSNLKMKISSATVTPRDNPEEVPATVPPDKFNIGGPFTISEGVITDLFLVFNANNALHQNGTGTGEYIINPSLKVVAKTVSGSVAGKVVLPPGASEVITIKVLADRDTDGEVSTFAAEAEEDYYFELIPLREGTHAISVEWITVGTECRLHEYGDVEVHAGQVTDVETINLLDTDPECS